MFHWLWRVEILIKALLIDIIALECNDPLWYINKANFVDTKDWSWVSYYDRWMSKVEHAINKNTWLPPCMMAFFEEYTNDYPPIWMLCENLTFGNIVFLLKNLNIHLKEIITHQFILEWERANRPVNHLTLISILDTLSIVRNISAHHGRLWRRQLVKIPNYSKHYPQNTFVIKQRENGGLEYDRTLYTAFLSLLVILENKDAEHIIWNIELLEKDFRVDMSDWWFPDDWKNRSTVMMNRYSLSISSGHT